MQFVRKMHPRFPDAELGNTADGDKERRQVLSQTKSVQANLTSMIQGERGTEHVSARMRIIPRRFSSYNTVHYIQLVFLTSDRNGRKTRDGTTQPAWRKPRFRREKKRGKKKKERKKRICDDTGDLLLSFVRDDQRPDWMYKMYNR